MRLEATTRIDYGTYRQYFLFNFLQGKRSPWQARVLIALTPVTFLAFLVLYAKNPADIFNLIGMLIMLALGFILLYILLVMPRRYYRSVQKLLEAPTRYIFSDDQLEVVLADAGDQAVSVKGAGSGISERGGLATRYEMIVKAYETKRFFYIYIGPNQAHILGKNDFSAGTADDLRELLKAKLRGRFMDSNY
jgi:hypothetical protein